MSQQITPFESIRRTNHTGNECWFSRDFAKVLDYAIFQNHGYMGLYGGLGAKDIHRNKGLKKSEQILDHMGSTELPANLSRTHPPSPFQRFSFDFVYAFCGFAGSCGVRYHSLGVQNFSFFPPPTGKSEPKSARPSRNST